MAPGSWATAPTRCIMPYGRHCPSCNRVGGAHGVLTLPATGSFNQFHTPTQRREGRECVPHDCGAVRMCACMDMSRERTQRRYNQLQASAPTLRLAGDRGSHRSQSVTPASVRSSVRLSMAGHRPCSHATTHLAASTLPCRRQHTSVPPQRLSSIWTCRRLFI
jgi:hypothetical protein